MTHPASIGPFRIERELGRGGMGVVYLATDTRLDRHVAVKSLPADLAADPDRMTRFQREARVLASLNHPSIGAIHGLESADGHQYLVLEFIEGETLADRLSRGPVPMEESLALARQMAEALEAAHDKGIIHRDLKPGNVMVTPEGGVKVLDFGLARTAEGTPPSTNAAAMGNSPTVTTPVRHSPTVPGVIMGTAGYMSPEQARGKPVDKRSDIFAFGCVVYEMLTGTGPFPGETVTDSLGAILHREPSWALLPPATPARVRELLTNCLAKDRRNRLHDIGDARLELDRAIAGKEWTAPRQGPARRGGPAVWALATAAGLALLAAGWFAARALERSAATAPARAFYVSAAIPPRPELGIIAGIAPDSSFVLYTALTPLEADSTRPGGVLAVRRLDRDETRAIEGTEGAGSAALSPDGRWVAFTAAKDRSGSRIQLKKLALDDGRPVGTPEVLCELPTGGGYSMCWSSDREIVIALGWSETILAVAAAGGEPRTVVRGERSREIDNWGDLRPLVAGKSILASRWALAGEAIKERTEVVDLATGERMPLLANAGGAQLVAGGYIVARRNQNTLIAAKLDVGAAKIIGEPVTVWSGNLRDAFFVSDDGTLATVTGSSSIAERRLAWLDERGQPQPIGAPLRPYSSIAVSPDGTRIATSMESLDRSELPRDLWVYDLTRRSLGRLATSGPAWILIWSPDGSRVTYAQVNKQEFSIWERRADGTGEAEKLYTGQGAQAFLIPTDWAPDGSTLAVTQVDLATETADVVLLRRDAGSQAWTATAFLGSPANEDSLRFSPDGKWVRFVSNETGQQELYVQRFSGPAPAGANTGSGRRQVSTGGARGSGWWSRDGKEIRYVDAALQVISLQVQTEPEFTVSAPKVLYSIKDLKNRDWGFAPDGRLMVVLEGDNERTNRIDLVVNFLGDVRAKVRAGR